MSRSNRVQKRSSTSSKRPSPPPTSWKSDRPATPAKKKPTKRTPINPDNFWTPARDMYMVLSILALDKITSPEYNKLSVSMGRDIYTVDRLRTQWKILKREAKAVRCENQKRASDALGDVDESDSDSDTEGETRYKTPPLQELAAVVIHAASSFECNLAVAEPPSPSPSSSTYSSQSSESDSGFSPGSSSVASSTRTPLPPRGPSRGPSQRNSHTQSRATHRRATPDTYRPNYGDRTQGRQTRSDRNASPELESPSPTPTPQQRTRGSGQQGSSSSSRESYTETKTSHTSRSSHRRKSHRQK